MKISTPSDRSEVLLAGHSRWVCDGLRNILYIKNRAALLRNLAVQHLLKLLMAASGGVVL